MFVKWQQTNFFLISVYSLEYQENDGVVQKIIWVIGLIEKLSKI